MRLLDHLHRAGRARSRSALHGKLGRRSRRIWWVEPLEPRCLLSGPTINPIPNVTVPTGKTLFVPLTASSAFPLTYAASSSDPSVHIKIETGNPFLRINVKGFGTMTFELFQDLAPQTTAIISGLVNSGFYDNLTFHRVVKNFVIQGGDPTGTGTGGPGFQFDDEFNASAIFSGNGQLAMANSGPDTNGSQFFVTIGPQRFLDFNYTIFGQLVQGFNVLDAINSVPVDSNDKPLTPVVISSAEIVPDPTDAVLLISTTSSAVNTATITVSAHDVYGDKATPVLFQATPQPDPTSINDPPFLNPTSNQYTTVNTPITFTLSATNIDDDTLQYEALTLGTPHAQVTVNGNKVTVTPDTGFTGAVPLQVGVEQQGATSRGSNTNPWDTQDILVVVGDPPIAVTADSVSPTPNIANNETLSISFNFSGGSAQASDFSAAINWGDDHLQNVNVSGGPGNFAITATRTYAHPGTYPVSVLISHTGGSQTSVNLTAVVTEPAGPSDFDGSGYIGPGVFRPSTEQWLDLRAAEGPSVFAFGPSNGIPVSADYDGDGKTDYAIYDPANSTWYIDESSGGAQAIAFGGPGDIPVPGDYDGVGHAEIAVFRPSTGQWFIIGPSGGRIEDFGGPGDIPVPADYDGDRVTDLAVFRPSNATWYVLKSSGGSITQPFGNAAMIPVPADYDGTGRADIAMFDPSTDIWYIIHANGSGSYMAFGGPGMIPIPGDYDHDGQVDLAVFQPTTVPGVDWWYILQSRQGPRAFSFGGLGDEPLTEAPAFWAEVLMARSGFSIATQTVAESTPRNPAIVPPATWSSDMTVPVIAWPAPATPSTASSAGPAHAQDAALARALDELQVGPIDLRRGV
jgi:cyclophilin family peptidyl-prolyl cis-trans isomerase/putative transposon-encoded protein